MPVRLNGSTSGYTELSAPAVAGSNTLVLPTGAGSAYQVLRNGGTAGSLEFTDKIVSGTAVASTSGTSIDFTGIPSWVKRVTVMFSGVSTSGSSPVQIQLMTGSSVPTTSGYTGTCNGVFDAVPSAALHSTGFRIENNGSANALRSGQMQLANLTGNTWSSFSVHGSTVYNGVALGGGTVALSAVLTGIRITSFGGTDTFDAGSINLLWE